MGLLVSTSPGIDILGLGERSRTVLPAGRGSVLSRHGQVPAGPLCKDMTPFQTRGVLSCPVRLNHLGEPADDLANAWRFGYINGPAGKHLVTDGDGICHVSGKAGSGPGVITGDRSTNRVSALIIAGKDDCNVPIDIAWDMARMDEFLSSRL